MKGLLLKDLLVITKQMRAFILLIVVFAVINRGAMTSFAVIYAAMMPMTALSYDERSKWTDLAAMMPYSSRAIVLSKYVLGYALVLAVTLLCLAVGLVSARFTGGPGVEPEGIAVALFLGLLFIAINLPLGFTLGVEKGRLAYLIIAMLMVLAVSFLAQPLLAALNALTISGPALAALAAAVIVALNAASIAISAAAYRKRFRN